MSKPVVHLYTVCWDEADMLGFFFRHYDPWVDRYVIYDDGSTDGSAAILQAHPKVELRRFARVDPDSFVLSHKAMQDEAWKESRGQADWVVITAIDEHLHVQGQAMADYLASPEVAGATMLPALGFDMNAPEMPDDRGLLVERVRRGRPRIAFNKLSLFRPDALRETGFGPGRHAAEPSGDLRLPPRDRVMLWHYKHLGFARNAAREATQARRLGTTDVARDYGQHYRWSREQLRGFWDEMEREATDLTAPGFAPDQACVTPLWWTLRPDIVRRGATPRPAAVPAAAPKVSVLIKSYQHARYVRQTVESVLAQSFQDFEIVATDDGSTYGTLEILRGFDDPRIRLESLPHNTGISAAMNATVARARGRYLAILNSDDWALPGRLARQVAFLDANPEIGLVFGMPQPVDESGQPTPPFNDFREPLRWPDFSRRTWLRQFFFRGNCLCAPTAMIRREAYEAAGPYDLRLGNLQDLDMWIRMLVAGQRIHVLSEALTAFRIRDNLANASAPRLETRLRSTFENEQILRRFAALDEATFAEVFGRATETFDPDDPVPLRVASLAARIDRAEHQHVAAQLAFEHAATPEACARLRVMTGQHDALQIRAVEIRDGWVAERDRALAEHGAALAERDAMLVERDTALAQARTERDSLEARSRDERQRFEALEDSHRAADALAEAHARRHQAAQAAVDGLEAERRQTDTAMRDLETRLAAALASRERMRASLSWRSTAFLRWIGRAHRALTGGSA